MSIQDTDKFLVERNSINYNIEAQDIMAIEDTDLLLIDRSSTNYKVEASELKSYVSLPFGSLFEQYSLSGGFGDGASSENSICKVAGRTISRSIDGFTWTTIDSVSGSNFSYISYGGNDTWLAKYGTDESPLWLKSTDDGVTWSEFTISHDFYNGLPTGGSSSKSIGQIVGAPGSPGTSNFMVYANTSSSGTSGPVISITNDGGTTWTYATIPNVAGDIEESSILESSAATVSDSPVWAIAILPSQGVSYRPSRIFYSTDGGSSWTPGGTQEIYYFLDFQGFGIPNPTDDVGSLGGGGNSLVMVSTIEQADSSYADKTPFSQLRFYDGSLTTLGDEFMSPFDTRAFDTNIVKCASYKDKIAAWGKTGTILLYDTSTGLGVSGRDVNLDALGTKIIGFKDRFFFFTTSTVYYTSKFT